MPAVTCCLLSTSTQSARPRVSSASPFKRLSLSSAGHFSAFAGFVPCKDVFYVILLLSPVLPGLFIIGFRTHYSCHECSFFFSFFCFSSEYQNYARILHLAESLFLCVLFLPFVYFHGLYQAIHDFLSSIFSRFSTRILPLIYCSFYKCLMQV